MLEIVGMTDNAKWVFCICFVVALFVGMGLLMFGTGRRP